jgi:hypothetical protein
MTGDTDQNPPDVKFARVERLVNRLTMGGQSPPTSQSPSPVVIT